MPALSPCGSQMPAHKFVIKRISDLPAVWQIQPSSEWYAVAAREMLVDDPSKLTSRLFFELPDCSASREYFDFCKSTAEREGNQNMVCVVLVNAITFDAGRGPGASFVALRHLHQHGYPQDIIRVAHLK